MRVSTPGAPFGIFENRRSELLCLGMPLKPSFMQTDSGPSRPPGDRSSQALPELLLCHFSRSGGLMTYFAPSKPGSSYCRPRGRDTAGTSRRTPEAAITKEAHLLERLRGREMDDVERDAAGPPRA